MKIYEFKGKILKSTSKDEVLRKHGLSVNEKTYKLVKKITTTRKLEREKRNKI